MLKLYKVRTLTSQFGVNREIAVRVGDLGVFNNTMATHESTFRKDDTYTLIARLRQNVIKTGLRTMSLTYSRISLRDVCFKLGLDSEETTEYIVAKAIRDGVIETTINHEGGYMQNKEVLDVYATEEPLLAFDERIQFCMSLRNEAIKVRLSCFGVTNLTKAMRFPRKESRLAEEAQKLREREKELVKEIEDGDLDDDDDVGPDFGV